jgi:N-acetylglucosaminyl-diphospho-decaprenol L-rhamnosyltransferase
MISLLVVNYRAAVLAAEAVRTARAATSQPLQVVIVDNSCDAREAEALRACADTLIISETNRGYAGAINHGRKSCDGETIIVANPDVTFAPHAIDLLVDHDAAVMGPALFWDDAHEWMLPPGDLMTAPQKLDEVLATRSRAWLEQRDRRRFLARAEFWSLRETTQVRMLSGAVMASRTKDFDALGGFDERFALYFEETDFLRRVTAARKKIVYVPRARVRHMYNQSASQVASEASARYAQSELRYLEKWNGPFAARTLKKLEKALPQRVAPSLREPITFDRDDLIIEASPLSTFATAAGRFSRVIDKPDARWTGDLYLRAVVRSTGTVLGTYKIEAA